VRGEVLPPLGPTSSLSRPRPLPAPNASAASSAPWLLLPDAWAAAAGSLWPSALAFPTLAGRLRAAGVAPVACLGLARARGSDANSRVGGGLEVDVAACLAVSTCSSCGRHRLRAGLFPQAVVALQRGHPSFHQRPQGCERRSRHAALDTAVRRGVGEKAPFPSTAPRSSPHPPRAVLRGAAGPAPAATAGPVPSSGAPHATGMLALLLLSVVHGAVREFANWGSPCGATYVRCCDSE